MSERWLAVSEIALGEARARVREAGGDELVERLEHLDAHRAARRRVAVDECAAPDRGACPDFDVVFAGGGLSLLIAAVLAARGVRVAVFERARAGAAHREWNASGPELRSLVRHGIVSEAELEEIVVARYRSGVCRFHGAGSYPVEGVLDHAVDAQALLEKVRARAVGEGVAFFDGNTVVGSREGDEAIAVRVRDGGGRTREVVARVLVDARGASSPWASADLVCPTVGGVVEGLSEGSAPDQIDPKTGDILATIEHATSGPQPVWEAFPGRAGQTTVYLFYYARAEVRASLLALYAAFFRDLPRYKRGDARLVRPTFGYIPGWSRLSPAPRAPGDRTVLVGDAAARHSPLTMCGFGAMLRSFAPAAHAIAACAESPKALRVLGGSAAHDAPIHALTGALAAVMAGSDGRGAELNALLGAAFASLHALGNEAYAALLRDEMNAATFARFLRLTARARPRAYADAFRVLTPADLARWGLRLGRALLA